MVQFCTNLVTLLFLSQQQFCKLGAKSTKMFSLPPSSKEENLTRKISPQFKTMIFSTFTKLTE